MKHITSRLLALLLTAAMIISMAPAVYAADEDVTIVENEQPTVEEPIVENSTEDTAEDTTVEPAKAAEANLSEGTTTDAAKTADGVTYATLADAIAAAKDGDTVTLLADVKEDVTITTDITLDLGGKTLTNTNAGKATLTVAAGATAIVRNGSIVGGTSYYTIQNNGTATFETITATAGNTGSSMIDNYGDLTITSGTYTGGLNVVKSEEDSKLTINGGKFTLNYATNGYTGVIFAYGTTTITGGEFIQSLTTAGGWDHPTVILTGVVEGHTATTEVTGGTFTNNKSDESIFRGVGKATSDNFEVYGGTYNKSVSDGFFKDGYFAKKNTDGTYGADGPYAAKIGSTGYDTLAAAVEAVANNGTITLLQDISSDRINLETKSFTVELNGHTLTSTAAYGVMFCAKNGKKITVKGDKYSKLVGTLMVTSGTDGHIVIKGGTYENPKYCPIYINGSVSTDSSTLSVKDAVINTVGANSDQDAGCAVYLAGYCTSTFTGTTITAPVTGIEIRAGKLTLKNCTVTGGNGAVTTDANGNGTTVKNAALAISQHTTKKPIDVTITGGKYTATAALFQTDVQGTGSAGVNATVNSGKFDGTVSAETNNTVAVKGGTFTSAVPENCCAEGFVPTQNTDGTYGVKVDTSVAEVNGKKYESLADAIAAAAENGQTVKLLSDVTITGKQLVIEAGKQFTLDLNGKTLKISGYTAKAAQVDVFGDLTLADSSKAQNGTICSDYTGTAGLVVCVEADGKLTMNGGTITTEGMAKAGNALKLAKNAVVTMNGGTVKCDAKRGNRAVNITGSAAQFTMTGGSVIAEAGDGTETAIIAICGAGSSTITISEDSIVSGPQAVTASRSNIAIAGGNFTGTIDVKNGSISGGTFDRALDEKACAAGFIPTENEDGTYGVKQGAYVAEISGTKYESLAEAVDAAKDGDTIKLLDNVVLT